MTVPPTICLNMIVKNEAHVVTELLDSVAPYISSWVIVDTGSDDGTQNLIRNHMARLGIPGELHERPWRDFGHNRNEALTLAQGHADYIWVMDADDPIVGTPDFSNLTADIYALRLVHCGGILWQSLLFRDGINVRYKGVVHEYASWEQPYVCARIEGDYHIQYRQLGARSREGNKYARDLELLLAEVERNPKDAHVVFMLAGTFFNLGDFVNARKSFERRTEMGGWDEELFYSLFMVAESMVALGEPWPEVQDAYLKAWKFRPTRVEPLYAIAQHCRVNQKYQLGYQFAKKAAEIPFPQEDLLYVQAEVYAWRATDEQATCAFWLGEYREAFALYHSVLGRPYHSVLGRPDLPDDDRQRIAENRDRLSDVIAGEWLDRLSPQWCS